ncbi:MAG TPA: AfsR/SARP family transcriptional regulator [Thermoleophilaceae bacterium]
MTEFGILGPLEVRRDGDELGLGGRNQRAVLALLLLQANQVVSIDRLAEALYSGATPATAVTQVHRQVSELRRVLDPSEGEGPAAIETRPPGYLIRVASGELDLHRFEELTGQAAAAMDEGDPGTAAEALRHGLAIWRGPALADLAYESFAQGPSARLQELRLAALEARIEAELALGHHARVIPELRDLASEHPLRERLRELLMVALYRSGRQVEALDLYRSTRNELVETFGVEPGPGLQQVEQAILRHDPELSSPRDDVAWRSRAARSVVLASRDAARLEAQLAVAGPLARQPARELVVALLVEEEGRLAEATAALSSLRSSLGPEARTAAFVASRGSDDILHLAGTADADLVLLGVTSGLAEPAGLPTELVEVLEKSSADVGLLFAPPDPSPAGGGVLVPFGGGEHDWAAVELGAWLAAATGERLRLAGARPEARRGGPDASRLLADASLAVQRLVGIAAEPALVDPGPSGLVEASADASAVVVGLSPRWRQEGLGEARGALARGAAAPLLVVHRGLRPSGIAPRESATRFTWSIAGG